MTGDRNTIFCLWLLGKEMGLILSSHTPVGLHGSHISAALCLPKAGDLPMTSEIGLGKHWPRGLTHQKVYVAELSYVASVLMVEVASTVIIRGKEVPWGSNAEPSSRVLSIMMSLRLNLYQVKQQDNHVAMCTRGNRKNIAKD